MWATPEQKISYENCKKGTASIKDIWSCYKEISKRIESAFGEEDSQTFYESEKSYGPDFKADMSRPPEVLAEIAAKYGFNLDETEKQILRAGYSLKKHYRNKDGLEHYTKYPHELPFLNGGKFPKIRWGLLKEAVNPLISGNGVCLIDEDPELSHILSALEENWVRQKRCGAFMSGGGQLY